MNAELFIQEFLFCADFTVLLLNIILFIYW